MLATSAMAADSGVGRIPVITRLVQVFSELESSLGEAVAKRDTQAVAKIVSDDFEMRIGAMPSNPIPRAAWIQQSFTEPQSSSVIEQMAVHDYGKVAVVSFLQKIKTAKSKATRAIYIVDVWSQGPDDWQLATRYASPAGKMDFSIPGATSVAPGIEKKE